MKKFFISIILILMTASFITAEEWWLKEEVKTETPKLQTVEMTSDNSYNSCYYILTLEIKQSHFSLDIAEHAKDSMNTLKIEIPVDKDYYYSLNKGDYIVDNFRMGSLLMKGSFGKWKIRVIDKKTIGK